MIDTPVQEELICTHCADLCPDDSIHLNDRLFCCYGCKAVYELIHSSGLSDHFAETNAKNESIAEIKAKKKYVFLENKDIQKQLVLFQDDQRSVVKLYLPNIHCSSCIYLLEHLAKLEPAVIRSEVNFLKKEVVITFHHHKKSLCELVVLLSQLGYPPEISLDHLSDDPPKRKSRSGIKIAVAGFCFGNAMLMSMPEYLDQNFLLSNDFKSLFGWINLALAIPVVFYSSKAFFIKAIKGLRFHQLNIDFPIALGILTLFLRSAFEIISQVGPGYVDSLAGLVFFLLIGKWYQNKTYQALSFERDYSSYFPISITYWEDGKEKVKPLQELKTGDTLIIHNDELIPADAILAEGIGQLDYSFVTGESIPVIKQPGTELFAGGRQKGSPIKVTIASEFRNSELTKLWNQDAFSKEHPGMESRIDAIAKYFTITIVGLALISGIYWYFIEASRMWDVITAVLIVACPCALALVLPFAYGHAMRLLGRRGLYLKNAQVIEPLGDIDQVVFDKTGTLTNAESNVSFFGEEISPTNLTLLRTIFGNSAHPLSRVILHSLPSGDKIPIDYFHEEIGKGLEAKMEGKLVKVGSAEFLELSRKVDANETEVHVHINGYLGFFRIAMSYRSGIFNSLENFRPEYKLSLLSGDNDAEKSKLSSFFNELKFRQKPNDKLEYISNTEGRILMIGDGLNDAGALKQASVGIAVADDIHQFSPACDAIISSDQVIKLPQILRFATRVKWIVYAAFMLSFAYNIVGLSFAISGHLTPLVSAILMPISSVTVVAFVTISVMLQAKNNELS